MRGMRGDALNWRSCACDDIADIGESNVGIHNRSDTALRCCCLAHTGPNYSNQVRVLAGLSGWFVSGHGERISFTLFWRHNASRVQNSRQSLDLLKLQRQ